MFRNALYGVPLAIPNFPEFPGICKMYGNTTSGERFTPCVGVESDACGDPKFQKTCSHTLNLNAESSSNWHLRSHIFNLHISPKCEAPIRFTLSCTARSWSFFKYRRFMS